MKSDQQKLIETICHLTNKIDTMEEMIRTKKERYENHAEEFSTIAINSISAITDNASNHGECDNVEHEEQMEVDEELLTINQEDIAEQVVNKKPKKVSTPSTKECVKFIKGEFSRRFSREELKSSRVSGGLVKYKGISKEFNKLSPNRLVRILCRAKKIYPSYDSIKNINEIINSKCRKATSMVAKNIEEIMCINVLIIKL